MKVLLMTFNASYIHPNLALRWLYVARDPKHDVLIKEYTLKDDLDRIVKEIETIKPDVIGMSVYIWNSEITKELIRKLQSRNHYRILVGGPEVSFESEEWLNEEIEGVLRGEGEITFWKTVNKEKEVDGLMTKDYVSPIPYAYTDISYLETLESPYFLAMDDAKRKNRYLYLETSRGCPYRCSYCLSSVDNQIRNFSLDYLFQQLDRLKEDPPKQVKFLDRTFNSHPKRALEIARYINDMDTDLSFQFEVALEHFPEELMEFFLKTKPGRFRFEVGVQSFNEKTLKAICRVQNEERLTKNIRRFAEQKIIMHTDLIAGLPFENYASFKKSFYKLFALHSDEIQMGILKLLKGTRMNKEKEEHGIIANPLPPYEVLSTAWIKEEEMNRIKNTAKMIDKTYNNHRLRGSFDLLYEQGFDIFEMMADLGEEMRKIEKVQLFDYFMELYHILMKYQVPYASEILLNDYYHQFNEKPKPLFKRPEESIRKELFKELMMQGYDEHELNQYSVFDYGFKEKPVYQLVFYTKEHCLDRIEYFDFDFKRISS